MFSKEHIPTIHCKLLFSSSDSVIPFPHVSRPLPVDLFIIWDLALDLLEPGLDGGVATQIKVTNGL